VRLMERTLGHGWQALGTARGESTGGMWRFCGNAKEGSGGGLCCGGEVLVRFIRGDLPLSPFCLERQGTAVATTNGYSAWCGVKLLFGFA
jgi:hypothetical protein